jgi:hypothetical protein
MNNPLSSPLLPYNLAFHQAKQEAEKAWIQECFQFILATPDKPWNWSNLSANPSITWDLIQAHPELPWDYDGISLNPNITWDIIQQHLEKPWSWFFLSSHPAITWEIIQAHPEKPWAWNHLGHCARKSIAAVAMANHQQPVFHYLAHHPNQPSLTLGLDRDLRKYQHHLGNRSDSSKRTMGLLGIK